MSAAAACLPPLLLLLLFCCQASCAPQAPSANSTLSPAPANSTVGSRIYSIVSDLPKLKNIVVFICGLTTLLIALLVIKVYRAGKKIRKTRKYDIITTPAERVEMAPLNGENYDEDDSTLFDVKYR